MRTPAQTPAFDFEELCFDHGDIVLAAIGWGEWQALERGLAEALARERDAGSGGERVDANDLRSAVVAFRRSHGLLAGEEYLRWLDERSLTTDDVIAHLKRQAFHARAGGELEEVLRGDTASLGLLEETIDGEAVLTGRLRGWAERLARCAAAKRGLAARGEDEPTERSALQRRLVYAASGCRASGLTEHDVAVRAPRVAELLAEASAFECLVATPGLIEQRLKEHRLDWQRLTWDEVIFGSEGAAREAAMMVRDDGLELGEVATLAHARTTRRRGYWSEMPELASLLVAAEHDELLGPFDDGGTWRIMSLRSRVPVSVADPELRERVKRELVEDALGRYLAGRVSWHVGY